MRGSDAASGAGGSRPSWLDTPPGAHWPIDTDEVNPFVRWRSLLWSHHRALAAGWSDAEYVSLVRSIDSSVAAVDGTGFVVTPTRREPDLDAVTDVVVKDETGNVGGSHKARHLMGLLLHLAVDAVATDTRLAISSCGNAALGAATVARAAGRPIDVFIPTWADPAVVARLEQLGATIHVCPRRPGQEGDPCMRRFRDAVDAGALAFGVQATENRWTLDGGRTIGWELGSQLADGVGRARSTSAAGEVRAGGARGVDHLLVQVGGGALLTSCAIGLGEAATLGPLEASPAVWAVQAHGCAPFDRAWRQVPVEGSVDARIGAAAARARELMTPWQDPHGAATGILDDVTYDWLGVARALAGTGGGSIVADEADIEAAYVAVRGVGCDADATGTAGYAGLLAAVRTGVIAADTRCAVLVTGVERR